MVKKKNDKVDINFSAWSILKTLLVIVGVASLYYLRDVIVVVLISYILSAALEPIIKYLEGHKISRGYGVLISYGLIFTIIVLSVVLISSPLVEQFNDFRKDLPGFVEDALERNETVKSLASEYNFDPKDLDLSGITKSASGVALNIFSAAGSVFSKLGTFFSIMVIAINISLQGNVVRRLLMFVSPNKYDSKVGKVIDNIENKLGQWMMGQFILALFIGVITYIGMVIIGLGEFALVLAFIAGITELIPMIGPLISGIINTFLGLIIGGIWVAIAAAVFAIVVQQFENSYLQPKIMSRAVGLNPILVMISLLVGGALLGVLGMILAVPIATISVIVLKESLSDGHREALFGKT